MSGPDRNASDESKPEPDAVRERIAQELAALGEDPLDSSLEDDPALAFALEDGDLHADIDVATLQTLAGWAEPLGDSQDELSELSEFAQARVWRTIELRSKADGTNTPNIGPAPARSTRPVLLGVVVVLLAVAAGVILVPVLTLEQPDDRPSGRESVAQAPAVTAEELDVLSTQARAGLAALDRLSGEPTGTARVEALATDYARRLEATDVGPRGGQG